MASSLVVAVFATVLMSRLNYHTATPGDAATRGAALTSLQETFVFGAALSLIGLAASLSIDDRKIAEPPLGESIEVPQGDIENIALEGPHPAGNGRHGGDGRLSAESVRLAGRFG